MKVTNLRVTQGYSELSLLHSDSRKDINRETKDAGEAKLLSFCSAIIKCCLSGSRSIEGN